jgi:TM2 domain-containing membrane protein YozV
VEAPPRSYLPPLEVPVLLVRPSLRANRLAAIAAAYVLWLPPFGLLGFHRFYLGRPASGFLYSLTCGAFGLGWLMDLFRIPDMALRSRRTGAAAAADEGEALGTAYLLWLLPWFGWFGAHRYYAGRFWSGLLYTLTGSLFLVGWLLDLFLMPTLIREARRPGSH